MTQILAIALHAIEAIADFLFAPNPVERAAQTQATTAELLRESGHRGLL